MRKKFLDVNMKQKGEKRLFGLFKKKTTPAPAAPPLQETVEEDVNRSSAAAKPIEVEETTSVTHSVISSVLPEDSVMPPRKGSIAQTSVIHYSPPGTVRASFPPSTTSSVVSDGSDDSGTVVITRKSNIVLDDEESVISTPVSQYDESPIVHKNRTKRAAPPPPPPSAPTSPISSYPSPSSYAPSPAPIRNQQHFRQESTNSINSNVTPPPPPPHKRADDEMDYEAMLKTLQTKFEQWHQVRLENEGSIKEEKLKAEVLKEHEKLKLLLEKRITSDSPSNGQSSSSNNNNNNNYKRVSNNNNNVKQKTPLKIPQYGNFYAQPPASPSPPVRAGVVPGGTVYQKTVVKEKPYAPPSSSSTSSSVPNGNPVSPKTDENRNEVLPKKKISATVAQNTEAVDRLRREVAEQQQREKEVKQYRNPKTLEVQVKSPEPTRKQKPSPPPQSPTKSPSGPRMVEYKPMKSPGLQAEDIYEEISDVAPPIPNTPPPKLSEYRKDLHSPRMPSVPTNGYVRLQMNGASKKQAPVAPGIIPTVQKIAQAPYTGPEFASSPKVLRKTPEPVKSTKVYSTVPVKEEKKVYEKPQIDPQMVNGNGQASKEYSQVPGMITATSSTSSTSNYQKHRVNPPMTRGASVDQNGYGYSTKVTIGNNIALPKTIPVEKSMPAKSFDYRKIQGPSMTRTPSEDQTNYGYASKTTINIVTSPYANRKAPPASPSNYRKSQVSPMARALSTDVTPQSMPSPSSHRKISAPVTTSSQPIVPMRTLSTEVTQSPAVNRRSQGSSGILSATSSKATITSATSPPYPKGSMVPTVVPVKQTIPTAPAPPRKTASEGSFDISDVLKGPKLRKVGMPVERSGISLGKVVDVEPSVSRPTSTPPPPPPPPPPPGTISSPVLQQLAPKNPDLRDSLMSEIREAGRLRAARAAQSA